MFFEDFNARCLITRFWYIHRVGELYCRWYRNRGGYARLN